MPENSDLQRAITQFEHIDPEHSPQMLLEVGSIFTDQIMNLLSLERTVFLTSFIANASLLLLNKFHPPGHDLSYEAAVGKKTIEEESQKMFFDIREALQSRQLPTNSIDLAMQTGLTIAQFLVNGSQITLAQVEEIGKRINQHADKIRGEDRWFLDERAKEIFPPNNNPTGSLN